MFSRKVSAGRRRKTSSVVISPHPRSSRGRRLWEGTKVHSIDRDWFWGRQIASSQETFVGCFGEIDFPVTFNSNTILVQARIYDMLIEIYTDIGYSNANEEALSALSVALPEVGSQQKLIPAQQKPT
ncbi:hypothetical protein BDZ89DRAFT_1036693 [Hymenopellis radicata]|nr:hypothetical protein BDZ89DRAFT_1036693 [Hymenopellis radicata]